LGDRSSPLRVKFFVTAEHKGEAGRMANAGDGHGIATIQGNIASFTPDGADADCRITLKFSRHTLVVTQTNSATSANTQMSTARTKKFRRANQSFVLRRSFILLSKRVHVFRCSVTAL
jgi:hypothetical protein